MPSLLIQKLHQASGWWIPDVEKHDFAEAIFTFYQTKKSGEMSALFREYANFLFRSPSDQTEDQVLERAKANIRVVSYAADLMKQGFSLFEALDKAAKTNKDQRCGEVVDFFDQAIKNYALVKIPEFRVMYNGALYARRLNLKEFPEDSISELLLVRKYAVPAEGELVEKINQMKPSSGVVEKDIHEFFTARGFYPKKEYFDFAYGGVPTSFLQKNIDKIKGLQGYESALSPDTWKDHPPFGLRCGLRSVPYDGGFPPRALLAAPDDSINKIVDSLYDALSIPQHFANVIDCSAVYAEYFALDVLGQFGNSEKEGFWSAVPNKGNKLPN